MMNDISKRTMKFSFFSAAGIALFSIASGQVGWAAGLLVSVLWSVVNFTMMTGVIEIAVLKKPAAKLSTILFVKFPVLYLIGYYILVSRFFPLMSIIAGLTLTLAVIGIVNIWPRRT